jgi:hypothetical protein
MTKNEVSIEELFSENYMVPESAWDRKRTKTTHFLLPTVFPNNSLMGSEFFVNAFVDDGGFKHNLDRVLFTLFKVDVRNPKWTSLSQRLKAKGEYLLEYFCGVQDGKHLIMMLFRIPDKYINEYINFLDGKYSKFSLDYKKLFPQKVYNEKGNTTDSIVWRVIHKDESLKEELERFFNPTPNNGKNLVRFDPEDELWGIPEPKYEVYRYE